MNKSDFQTQSRIKPMVGVFMILVAISLFIFAVLPVKNKVSLLEAQITANFSDLNVTVAELTRFESEKNEMDLLTEVDLNRVKNAIPFEMRQDNVIRDLISISEQNTVKLNTISFGKGGEGEEGISVLRVNASFEGSFNDLIRFLQGLEGNSRKFVVNSISVQLASIEIGGVRRANFSLAMETYFIGNQI